MDNVLRKPLLATHFRNGMLAFFNVGLAHSEIENGAKLSTDCILLTVVSNPLRCLNIIICMTRKAGLEGLEQEGREAKKGLWADPRPVPTWEWRKRE